MSIRKKGVVVLLILCTIAIGYIRDYIFVSINSQIVSGNSGNLSAIKWLLTMVFSVVFFFLTCSFLLLLFSEKKLLWLAVYAYSFLMGVSLLIVFYGYLTKTFSDIYPYTRAIIGVAQSPVVMMVLIPLILFSKKEK